jgi:Peptidase S24-like
MRAAGLRRKPIDDVFEQPSALWGGRKVVALKVRGTTMVDEGLHDGDHLIVEPRDTASDGQTVVAEVDGELTVKRVFHETDGRLRLKPANSELLPLAVTGRRVRIVGTLVGVFRRQGFPKMRRAPGPRPPRVEGDERTLDLTLRVIDQSVQQAETLAASRSGAVQARLRELAQGLRTLRDCYVDTRTPKLREALLREAGTLVRRVRRFDAERRRDASLGSA